MIASYTTNVGEEQTVGEIRKLLRKWAATSIGEEYDPTSGVLIGISFTIGGFAYKMSCDYKGVFAALQKDLEVERKYKTMPQARRVAWRNMLGWLKFTMSLVEAGLFSREQVLMPYHLVTSGQTMWEMYEKRNQAQLEVKE